MECDFLMQKVIMLISIITEGHRPKIESNQRPPSTLFEISGVFVQGTRDTSPVFQRICLVALLCQ